MATDERSRGPVWLAVGVGGLGLAHVVVHDGSPGWQVARLLALLAIAALLMVRHRGKGGGGWVGVEWLAGAVLCAVGVGVAVPHLSKTGVTVTAVAGLLARVGGAVLLVSGTTRLLRSVRWWGRPPLAGALLLLLAVIVLSLGQAVAATNVPRTTLGERTPTEVGLAYREVSFEASDGVLLSAWYVPSENGAAVVLLHEPGSTRTAVLDHARVLAAYGYGLLLVDARGHGRSSGRAMDLGWYGDEDISGAVSFVASQPDVSADRIALLGLSMGGEEALGAAATDPRVRAVVAEGATNRVASDKAWLSTEHGWRGSVQRGIDRLTYGFADILTAASPPISLRDAATAISPRPVLLIAGGAVPEEPPASRFIAGGAPGDVELWVVPGAGHTGALERVPDEWEARVAGFLTASLSVGEGEDAP